MRLSDVVAGDAVLVVVTVAPRFVVDLATCKMDTTIIETLSATLTDVGLVIVDWVSAPSARREVEITVGV